MVDRGPRAPGWHTAALVAVGLGLAALASACGDEASSIPIGAPDPTATSIYALPPVSLPTTSTTALNGAEAAFLTMPDGVVMPDPESTTGAVFDQIHEADICNLHYTQGIRQPRYNDKVEAFAEYGISIHDRDLFQLDHLVPISLGGANSLTNLWPQPLEGPVGAVQKDEIERQLRGLVCSGAMSLADAQTAIRTNWWGAYQAYMGQPIAPGSEGLMPWTPPVPEVGEVVNGGPCTTEGEVGYTQPKNVPLTCTQSELGALRWEKRY